MKQMNTLNISLVFVSFPGLPTLDALCCFTLSVYCDESNNGIKSRLAFFNDPCREQSVSLVNLAEAR